MKMSKNGKMAHQPEHPLPEEIQKMARDETVCKFCGVSYLIHNEIKALEDKLKAAESELAYLRGSETREEALKVEIDELKQRLQKLEQTLVAKDADIATATHEIKERDVQLEMLNQRRLNLEKLLSTANQKAEQFSAAHGLFINNLPNVKSQLSQLRAHFSEINSQVTTQRASFSQQFQAISRVLTSANKSISAENQSLGDDLSNMKVSLEISERNNTSLQHRLSELQSEVSKLRTVQEEVTTLRINTGSLQATIKLLQEEVEAEKTRSANFRLESEQYEDQLRSKSKEVEQLTSQLRNNDMSAEQNVIRLEKRLSEREAELKDAQTDVKILKKKIEDQQRIEQEIRKQASASGVQADELVERYERCRGDVEALKAEREMMINAHQNQIEQLRESFKRRIADADKWQEKVDEAIRAEKAKQAVAMKTLEDKLKENFIMELDIEKQKHQKLLDQTLEEYRERQRKLEAELNGISASHKAEVTEVHKQLAETKARAREAENSLRTEISSLKNIIKDLESRLGRLDLGSDASVTEMKSKLSEVERNLEDAKCERDVLDTALKTTKEEILFLQETVRKECEERFELTEALSAAREELLALKRPPGGYQSVAKKNGTIEEAMRAESSLSQKSSASSRSSRSEEFVLFKKVTGGARRPVPHPPTSARDMTPRSINNTPASVQPPTVAVPCTDPSPQPVSSRGLKGGGSLKDSRKRIEQAIGRT